MIHSATGLFFVAYDEDFEIFSKGGKFNNTKFLAVYFLRVCDLFFFFKIENKIVL